MKILIYDIETYPNLAYVWGKYEQDVIAYERETVLASFAYKWYGEGKMHVVALNDFKSYKKDKFNDYELVKKLYELFNEADVIIAHNGNSFDQKKAQARFIYWGFNPPAPYKQIDTKLVFKRYFNLNSNKLDDIANYLGIGRKIQTGGFNLWLGCMNGDKKAWDKMKRYNIQDVVLLEKVYKKVKGWIHNHPNLSIESGEFMCKNCGSKRVQQRGWVQRLTGAVKRFQCNDCGAWGQLATNKLMK